MHAESANCAQHQSCYQYTGGITLIKTLNNRGEFKVLFTIHGLPIQLYHFQADLIWGDGTFKRTNLVTTSLKCKIVSDTRLAMPNVNKVTVIGV